MNQLNFQIGVLLKQVFHTTKILHFPICIELQYSDILKKNL